MRFFYDYNLEKFGTREFLIIFGIIYLEMFYRIVSDQIFGYRDKVKAVVLTGARQVGKTTLIKNITSELKTLWIDGDDIISNSLFENINKVSLLQLIEGYECIVFDEAQRINNIGLIAKMILDAKTGKELFILGSSTIQIKSSVNESLTGRKWTFSIFPLTWFEIVKEVKLYNAIQSFEQILIYGSYPEVFTTTKKIRLLKEITSSYLFKDIIEIANIRMPQILGKLLQALAYQVGSEVSYHELSQLLKIDAATVEKYIHLLEESFVIFRLSPLSTNPRKEISTSKKIYFYDNGIRNAVVGQLQPINQRQDQGQLFENFIVSEFKKKLSYIQEDCEMYFWRSKTGSEIDLIIKNINGYTVYEIKYNASKRGKFSPSFLESYNPILLATINKSNFYNYL